MYKIDLDRNPPFPVRIAVHVIAEVAVAVFTTVGWGYDRWASWQERQVRHD